jgi:RNA polymerase sigma-70 factor (ECF subfamily)
MTASPPENAGEEHALVEALRRGDEGAFVTLVERYHASLVRLARLYVPTAPLAEDVAQETWLGVLQSLPRFEGRSSLQTWLFRILANRARTRAVREARSIPFSALWSPDQDADEPAVDPDRVLGPDHPHWPGHWGPRPPEPLPEERLLGQEAREVIRDSIQRLPPAQREVITLRDVEGWSSAEVCNALAISETNQRVLLHRARSRVRRALEQYSSGGQADG